MVIRNRFAPWLAVAAALVATATAHAANVTWDTVPGTVGPGNGSVTGGSGTWDTTNGNWTVDGGVNNIAWVNGNNDTAIFGAAAGTVTLGADVTVGGMTFNTNAYSVAPGGFGITFGTAGSINVSTGTTTISAPIGGSAITKTGAQVLVLSGANSFSGLTIDAGIVRAEGGGNSFGASGSTITINGGGIQGRNTQVHQQGILLNQTLTQFVKGNNGAWQFTGAVTGAGGLQVNGGAGVFSRTLTFSSTANTFTGVVNMTSSNSTFYVNSLADSVGAGNILFNNSLAFFGLGSGTAVPITLNNRRVEMTASGGTNRIGNANADTSNILTINTDLLSAAGAGTKTLQFEGVNAGDNAFNGVIANGGIATLNVTKTGNGKWILGGANTYNGNTFVDQGTLALADDAELRFYIGANGVNNSILGDATNATLTLDGDFVFDLTGASTTLADSWNIVEVAELTETYGATFNVRSTLGNFTNNSGVWTIAENGSNYEFVQSTGVLTVVVPEPASLALAAAGLGAMAAIIRRRSVATSKGFSSPRG